MDDYCQAVDLPYRTFETYLPAVYLHRLELDWQLDAVSTYTDRIHTRTNAVESVFRALEGRSIH